MCGSGRKLPGTAGGVQVIVAAIVTDYCTDVAPLAVCRTNSARAVVVAVVVVAVALVVVVGELKNHQNVQRH